MARPIAGVAPKSEMFNCKLTEFENNELTRIIEETGIKKSDLFRLSLKIIFQCDIIARSLSYKRVEELIKNGKINFDSLHSVREHHSKLFMFEFDKLIKK
ncbi:hypothetical protein K9K77_03635 [Candidatus Babeliales bacterium]|nr:hypothetical protein [Candidatus Babeliales bacterium]